MLTNLSIYEESTRSTNCQICTGFFNLYWAYSNLYWAFLWEKKPSTDWNKPSTAGVLTHNKPSTRCFCPL